MDIAAWLRELGLERYEQAFQDNEVDTRSLPHLTADDLKDIGVTASDGVRQTAKRVLEAERRQLTDRVGSQIEPHPHSASKQQSLSIAAAAGSAACQP